MIEKKKSPNQKGLGIFFECDQYHFLLFALGLHL